MTCQTAEHYCIAYYCQIESCLSCEESVLKRHLNLLKKERMKTTSSSNLSTGTQNAITAIVFVVLIMLVNYLNINS